MTNTPQLEALQARLGARWEALDKARAQAASRLKALHDSLEGLDSADVSIVVFGSVARCELTSKSDPDWTLLIDGQAASDHLETSREIRRRIEPLFGKEPGREQTFGGLAFSHQLVHLIGGEDDTNKNTTRRILLLLESQAVGRSDAYDRVVKAVLERYLLEDRSFAKRTATFHVPRFLQNDIARYWRTMAVDFAYKARTRAGEGAVLRNIKLRMSRKLIYVSGLLTCFACAMDMLGPAGGCSTCSLAEGACVACLRAFMNRPPLEVVANVFERLKTPKADEVAREFFGAYDKFIAMLDDTVKRKHLEKMSGEDLDADDVYQEARKNSHAFRDAVDHLFFAVDETLARLTREYGVF